MAHPYVMNMSVDGIKLKTGWSRRDFVRALLLGGVAMAAAPGRAFAASDAKGKDLTRLYAALVKELNFCRKSAWAGEDPIRSRLRPATPYKLLTVHHEGQHLNQHRLKGEIAADIQNIQAGHCKRKYGDIAYHFIVDQAGRVWEGRSLQYQGAHVSDHNAGNVGIMLLGNFERQQPSEQQLTGLNGLVGVLRQVFPIPADRVYGHCDLAQTLCPGARLYPHIARMRTAG
ncbi:MAG: N-acetylmuramoyl-L-alanine amidase [Spartobacteria bacterium]|nr:N-acetylmuramoyl-L-alanine amidase [Spartobacteria bacterium]